MFYNTYISMKVKLCLSIYNHLWLKYNSPIFSLFYFKVCKVKVSSYALAFTPLIAFNKIPTVVPLCKMAVVIGLI